MENWLYVKKEDIEIDLDGREINIWFESDDFGNRYVTFLIEWIEELLKKHKRDNGSTPIKD